VQLLKVNRPWRPVLFIILLGLGLYLGGSWLVPLIDRDEPRFAEATREMQERGDWVVPWFNDAPRYDKPPLIYWAQSLSYRCFGESALTARLPSALFATGAALLLFFWARRLTAPRTALVAAVMFLTCLQVAIHARLAVADLAMIFFVCAAQWSGWEYTRPAAVFPWRWWAVFYASLALGFLAKGPVAWLPIAGLALGRWYYPKEFTFGWARFLLGLLLILGLVAIWGIPALIQTHGDFLKVGLGYHVIDRSFEVLQGHGVRSGCTGWVATLPFYLVTFFFSFFPWSLWSPQALRRWWPGRRQDVFGWYLFTQVAVVFLVFTLVRTKLPHYTLPAFPCLALWLARTEAAGWLKSLSVAKVAAGMSVLILTIAIGSALWLGPTFVSHSLFEKARPQLQPAMEFATIDYKEPALVWEFRQVLTNHLQLLSVTNVDNFLNQTNPSILIMSTGLYETNFSRLAGDYKIVQVQGMNWATSKRCQLTAIIHS
jgi:4-amino-4-deoxy-L-arabinose transferase-like glycosyltransferase